MLIHSTVLHAIGITLDVLDALDVLDVLDVLDCILDMVVIVDVHTIDSECSALAISIVRSLEQGRGIVFRDLSIDPLTH